MYKQEEEKKEVIKPFTFVNLGINNIDAHDVLESDSSYTYIQSDIVPNMMVPLDNPYDTAIKHNRLVGNYFEKVGNTNEFEYINNTKQIGASLVKRALSSIAQNIIIVYKNGFERFVTQFVKEENGVVVPHSVHVNIADGVNYYSLNDIDIFKTRTGENVADPYYGGEFARASKVYSSINYEDTIANVLDGIGFILGRVAYNYDLAIKQYIEIVDIEDLAESALNQDGIGLADSKQAVGVAIGVLNQIAKEDIEKIREIAEINLMQAVGEFFGTAVKIDQVK